MECGVPRLSVGLAPVDFSSETPYVGEQEASGTLAVGDEVAEVTGRVVIAAETRLTDGRVSLEGSLEMAGEGTSVRGELRVIECRDLDRSGP